jgi:hypothetical protein
MLPSDWSKVETKELERPQTQERLERGKVQCPTTVARDHGWVLIRSYPLPVHHVCLRTTSSATPKTDTCGTCVPATILTTRGSLDDRRDDSSTPGSRLDHILAMDISASKIDGSSADASPDRTSVLVKVIDNLIIY